MYHDEIQKDLRKPRSTRNTRNTEFSQQGNPNECEFPMFTFRVFRVFRGSHIGFASTLLVWSFILSLAAAQDSAAFKPAKLAEMDAAITNAIAEKKLPGGVLWLERH